MGTESKYHAAGPSVVLLKMCLYLGCVKPRISLTSLTRNEHSILFTYGTITLKETMRYVHFPMKGLLLNGVLHVGWQIVPMHRSIQKFKRSIVKNICSFSKKTTALPFGFTVLVHICVNEYKVNIIGREYVLRSCTVCVDLAADSSSGLRNLFLKIVSAREGTSFSASDSESISPSSSLKASSSRASILVKTTTSGTWIESNSKWTTFDDE